MEGDEKHQIRARYGRKWNEEYRSELALMDRSESLSLENSSKKDRRGTHGVKFARDRMISSNNS